MKKTNTIAYEEEMLEKVKKEYSIEEKKLLDKGLRVQYKLWWMDNKDVYNIRPKSTYACFVSIQIYEFQKDTKEEHIEFNFPIVCRKKKMIIDSEVFQIAKQGCNNILENGYETELKKFVKSEEEHVKKRVRSTRLRIFMLISLGILMAVAFSLLFYFEIF